MFSNVLMRCTLAAALGMTTLIANAQMQATAPAESRTASAVQDDLQLWHQAGMSFLPSTMLHDEVRQTSEYRKYQALRAERDLQDRVAQTLETAPTAATQTQGAVPYKP